MDSESNKNDEVAANGFRREVRTFVLRAGHFTNAERKDYEELLPVWGIGYDKDSVLDFRKVFGNDNPVVIEIGFGMGRATAIIAENNPDINYLGIEVHKPGIGKLLGEIRERNLKNIRIIAHDAMEVISDMVADGSVDAFHFLCGPVAEEAPPQKAPRPAAENGAAFEEDEGGRIPLFRDGLASVCGIRARGAFAYGWTPEQV